MCESMINTSLYTALEGTTHKALLVQEMVFSVSELGLMHVEDMVITSLGKALKVNGHIALWANSGGNALLISKICFYKSLVSG